MPLAVIPARSLGNKDLEVKYLFLIDLASSALYFGPGGAAAPACRRLTPASSRSKSQA